MALQWETGVLVDLELVIAQEKEDLDQLLWVL